MLTSELTRRFGLRYPIIQAGMGDECGFELASAVSNAGALGSVGSIGRTPDDLRDQIARCRTATDQPFAVNVVTFPWAPFAMDLVDVALDEEAPILTLSFGDPLPALERCKAAGALTAVQVQDATGAKEALAARPDALVVQGTEAGGHTGHRGTLSFAAQVLDMAGDVPVVLAGGVGNGRGLAAALAMGAAGVMMGTRFKATSEYGPGIAHEVALKAAIVASDGEDSVFDPLLDMAYGLEWPNGVLGRALHNRFVNEWAGRETELTETVEAAGPFGFVGELGKSPDTAINWAGQSSALVHEVLPAARVVEDTVAEAERLLRAIASSNP